MFTNDENEGQVILGVDGKPLDKEAMSHFIFLCLQEKAALERGIAKAEADFENFKRSAPLSSKTLITELQRVQNLYIDEDDAEGQYEKEEYSFLLDAAYQRYKSEDREFINNVYAEFAPRVIME